MSEQLRSVGLDVGTTSTQLIVSMLTVENQASSFAVPQLEIARREILYKSPIHFTPLLDESHVDGEKLREIVEREYQNAGITRSSVDTGAIIITGETSRKENARRVLEALADLAGDFVVATAGPDLESILAAKGSGAVDYSRETGKTVLHMDIGGGTSNLALIRDGKIVQTGCLNVGGRLLKVDGFGKVSYISPVLQGICSLKIGDTVTREAAEAIADRMVQALEMAAGLRQATALLQQFLTREVRDTWHCPEERTVMSFSGGVAECIDQEKSLWEFADMGPVLGKRIRASRLCEGEYRLGTEAIRATVIGAGCHSTQLSGSTVFHQNLRLPLKNLPVVEVFQPDRIRELLEKQEGPCILALPGMASLSYRQITALAEQICAQAGKQLLLCMEQDMAKALGQALAVRLPGETEILCIDRVKVGEDSYLDIGTPVAQAFPVVVKTLVLNTAGKSGAH